jgi:hypothetical protein
VVLRSEGGACYSRARSVGAIRMCAVQQRRLQGSLPGAAAASCASMLQLSFSLSFLTSDPPDYHGRSAAGSPSSGGTSSYP